MPSQDCGPFGLELCRKVRITFLRRYLHGERHQQHSAPHSLIDVIESRFVIADNPQLELRHEVEEVAAHEPGRHSIAAGHALDLGLVPAAPLLRLLRHYQTVAVQLRYVSGVALSGRGDERADSATVA